MLSWLIRPRAEATSTLQNPAAWLLDFASGHLKTKAGVNLSESSALTYAAVYGCVGVVSRAMGCLPWRLLRKTSRGKAELRTHRTWTLLHDEPNRADNTSPFSFKETTFAFSLLWGNSYAEILRNVVGEPVALQMIEPPRVKPKRNASGEIVYAVRPKVGATASDLQDTRDIPSRDILHIRGIGDGLQGWSVIALARESLGLGMAMERFGARWFGNGAWPAGFLKHPGRLDPKRGGKKAIRESFQAIHGGPDKSHQVGVLEEGMEWVKVGVPPEDSQFLQSREFELPQVCRWFNVPPSKIFDLRHAHYRNIEHLAIAFVQDTLAPWAIRAEEEANRKLLTPEEREAGIFTKFNLNAQMRGDSKTRGAFYKTMRDLGCFSPNDILELEDRNTLGPEGDLHLVPMNMQTLEAASAEPELPPEPAPATAPLPEPGAPPGGNGSEGVTRVAKVGSAAIIADAVDRLVRKEINAVQRASTRYEGKDAGQFSKWLDGFYAADGEFARNVRDLLAAPVRALAQLVAFEHGVEIDETIDATIRQATDLYAARHVRESREAVLRASDNGGLPPLFEKWRKERAAHVSQDLTDETAGAVLLLVSKGA